MCERPPAHLPRIAAVAWGTGVLMTAAFLVAHNSMIPARQVLFDNVQWTVAHVGAAVLAWLGFQYGDTHDRASRCWFAIGLSSYALGQALWNLQIFSQWTPFPAPSDLFYAACGPCVAVGFWLALRQRIPPRQARVWMLDTAILVIQALIIVLVLYLSNLPNVSSLQLAELAIYPIVMFGAAIVGLMTALALGLRTEAHWLLLPMGLIVTGLAWMPWNIADMNGTPDNGTWLNYSFAVASLLRGIGAAQWNTHQAQHIETPQRSVTFYLLMPLAPVMAAVATVVLVWESNDLPHPLRVAVMCGAAAVIVLSVVRQSYGLAERERLLRAERAMLEQEQQFRVLAQRFELATSAAHLGIWDIDLTRYKTAVWESRMYALFGYEQSTAKSPYEIWEHALLPQDAEKIRSITQTALQSGKDLTTEYRITTAQGELRHLESYGVIQRDASGVPLRMTGVAWDVTERATARHALAESEAELSAIFENSVIGIVLADQQRHILRYNRAARELLGYSAEAAARVRIEDVLHPDERELSLQLFNSLLSGERDLYQQEKRYRRADGQHLWVRITVYPVTLNAARNFVCLIEDISQRRHTEEQLLVVQRNELRVREEFSYQLMNAQEHERQRIANELHDSLGQSLSVIKNRAQLALEQVPGSASADAQLQGILRVTTDAISEVRGLAHNLRPLHIEQLGLTAALQQLLEQFAEATHLQIESRIEAIDEVFRAEQVTHIYRLLQEALNNIGKHAQAKHVKVLIERDLHVVRIAISDDGVGFSVHRQQASGLGLNSMTERAHMLGGQVRIVTEPTQGTQVLFELPIADVDAHAEETSDMNSNSSQA